MTPERWQQIKALLDAAVAMPAADRETFLGSACANDAELRREVQSLLDSHEQAPGGFLEPAWTIADSRRGSEARDMNARVGAYKLQERLGRGGMGDVFAAVRDDGQYEQRVAVKLVRGELSSSGLMDRFRSERQILASLDHPHIARLLDGGASERGEPYLVMELVEGVPIDTFCRDRALSTRARLELFLRVCSAVQYAHQHLVVHRDLKPGNILVTHDSVPKLLDFGIAKILDPLAAAPETVLRPFTPDYASPEQVRGEPASTASDVYALGVILYELLTGRSPYRAERRTAAAIANAVTCDEPDRASLAAGNRELRGDLDAILSKALRKEPELRYASVEHFADDIRRHLSGEPVVARKGTWTYRSTKFLSRHRAGVAAAALVVSTLVAGIALTAREARLAELQRRRADARFNDVRKLANSLLFEIHDSIATLPGATDARNLILNRSLEYLDSLAREAGDEPVLARELASAYQRIAGLQGNATDVNLGHIDAARASYAKAIGIRESLVRTGSETDSNEFELGRTLDDFATFQLEAAGDAASALDAARRARTIFERRVAAAPEDWRAREALASARITVAWIETGEGLAPRAGTFPDAVAELGRALADLERIAARDTGNERAQSLRGTAQILLGDALLKQNERVEAIAHYGRAHEVLGPVAARGHQESAVVNESVLDGKIGDALIMDGDVPGAIRSYQSAVDSGARLLAGDPHNQFVQQQHALVAAELAHAFAESGRVDDAVRMLNSTLDSFHTDATSAVVARAVETLMRAWLGESLERQQKWADAAQQYAAGKALLAGAVAHGASPRVRSYYATSADRLGSVQFALGALDDAEHEYDEAEKILEPLVRADPGDYELACALADTYTRRGAVAERRGHCDTAAERYRQSLAVWKVVPNPARISTSGFEVTVPGDVARRLARCERTLDPISER